MLSPQPIHPWKYLSLQRATTPPHLKRLFYLSWEDALWDLLAHKKIKKQSVILVPEFFCCDVEENMKLHGYVVKHYPVSADLITTSGQLAACIIKYHPKVVVVFHAVGITNKLLTTDREWLKQKPETCLLIEDSVHRIVAASDIKLLCKNHFVIDSLRKVVPLQGSVVYGNKNELTFNEPPFFQAFWYAFLVTIKWSAMNMWWTLAQLVSVIPSLSIFCATRAERAMQKGYDLIGDSELPARGFLLFNLAEQFLAKENIKKIKKSQVLLYQQLLSKLSFPFRCIPFSQKDAGELRGVPIVIEKKCAEKVLQHIRSAGFIFRFELQDSKWGQQHKIIYLPLGPYITEKNIQEVCRVFTSMKNL